MTIDRFTNTIINAFSKELDLLPSYDIILDEKEFMMLSPNSLTNLQMIRHFYNWFMISLMIP